MTRGKDVDYQLYVSPDSALEVVQSGRMTQMRVLTADQDGPLQVACDFAEVALENLPGRKTADEIALRGSRLRARDAFAFSLWSAVIGAVFGAVVGYSLRWILFQWSPF